MALTEIEVNIPFPLHDPEQILKPLSEAIKQNPEIKVASLDHISSYPAALPIKEMVKLCKDAGIFVLVDGAHVLGQIPLNISDIGADAYIANVHKWCYNPKSAALVHVNKKWQSLIMPNILSGDPDAGFEERCWNRKLRCAVFFSLLCYLFSLFLICLLFLSFNFNISGSRDLGNFIVVTNKAMVPALSLIALPSNDPSIVWKVNKVFNEKYQTWIQVSNVTTTDGINTYYIHLSAQVYLEESDFITMAHRYLEIMKELL
eukprot:TRINITY_DN7072_c0_g1_i2.p1 TRINITY_DN7072_c0_g1~~TRINITY_DN7072_c0_g1_i2.p1  ORF type:complete len:260 (+),score=22.74 TRINITY_DN7072_c0_g1_i2:2142-2921(+)